MLEAPHDICDNCGQAYPFVRDTDYIIIFLRDWECNHVDAHCPFCEYVTCIYAEPESLLSIQQQAKLTIRMYPDAPDEIKKQVAKLNGYEEEPVEEFPELPGWVWKQLGDDIRKFERGEFDG